MGKIFNNKSMTMLKNILNGFNSSNIDGLEVYTSGAFATAPFHIDLYLKGVFYNKYLFCSDRNGNLESIAIYGKELNVHLMKIRSSMICFGLSVESVKMDREGFSDFVDIILDPIEYDI
ncbi:hypothetical protein D0T51_12025 [Parabacteroides sp. 52]|uniref:hypothetical protein n=1 Tax=unclassified Parabacteroides TaxID=2649774 RepID=UPI0013CF5A62|nr:MULTISPECIES: hypothetical protein [unclassified Parabacteroides]MDH6535617.1 hypothetical protein [Parabacteroides sp. PM5-20]NDV56447.1 hypothetical protein [Parabacteroides sp. 52]